MKIGPKHHQTIHAENTAPTKRKRTAKSSPVLSSAESMEHTRDKVINIIKTRLATTKGHHFEPILTSKTKKVANKTTSAVLEHALLPIKKRR